MSFSYTVGDVKDFNIYPEGEYVGRIESLRAKTWSVQLALDLLKPQEREGDKFYYDFNIYSDNEITKEIAINNLNKFGQVVGELKSGEVLSQDLVADKIVKFLVRHTVSKGTTYMNIVKWELVKEDDISPSPLDKDSYQAPAYPINDEVPF